MFCAQIKTRVKRSRYLARIYKLNAQNGQNLYNFGGILFFKTDQYVIYTTTKKNHLPLEKMQHIHIQCHGNYIEVNIFRCLLQIPLDAQMTLC